MASPVVVDRRECRIMKNKEKQASRLTRKYKKRIFLVTCVGVLALAAVYTLFLVPMLKAEQWIFKEAVVERGNLVVGVTESGQLKYGIQSVNYELDLSDDSDEEDENVKRYLEIEEIKVAPGQRILEGDALLALSEDSIESVRKLLNSALSDARVESGEAQSEYDLEALEARSEYEAKVLSGEYAADIYTHAQNTVANQVVSIQTELSQCQNKVESLSEALQEAQESFDEVQGDYMEIRAGFEAADPGNAVWYSTVLNEYMNAQSRYENSKTALDRAKENLESNQNRIAELEQELAVAGVQKHLEQMEADEAYQEAMIGKENAEIIYQARLESLKATLEEAQEAEQQAWERLNAFEDFVGEDGILYAANPGIVTEVLYEAGDSLVEQGVILSYAMMEDMTITVDVTQEDVVDLQVGDRVDIAFTAYENQGFEGIIQEMNTTSTSQNSDTVSYEVVIAVGGKTELLYDGMTADITFVTEKKEDVLYLSRNAIVQQEGKTYVYTSDNKNSLKQVEVGLGNGISVEILSGLEEGDKVYIASIVASVEEADGRGNLSSDAQNEVGNGQFTIEDFINSDMELPEGMPQGMEFPGGGQFPNMDNSQFPGSGEMKRPGGEGRQGRRTGNE